MRYDDDYYYDDEGEPCGPLCEAVECCGKGWRAATADCPCGGGLDHSDCPQDWRAYLDGDEVGAGHSEDEALADAQSVVLPCDWDRIEVSVVR